MAHVLQTAAETTLMRMNALTSPLPSVKPLAFVRRGEAVTLANVPPSRTLLQLLREDLGLTSVKEGCAEGDCGACTVVVAEPHGRGLRYRAINSCIRLAHAVDGQALWTAEDLANDPLIDRQGEALHPVQQALVDAHASQCGFCTPGFVMSLFALYQNRVLGGQVVDRTVAQADLSGNLCRCTGYRPILAAAMALADYPLARVNETRLRRSLRQLAAARPEADDNSAYLAPTTLVALLQARARRPQAQLVAGTTDVGLWVTKGQQRYTQVLDLTRCAELQAVERYPHHIAIGAAVPLHDAFAALVAERPGLATFAQRFAGLPVRQAGTLGGNVTNGSPIGDSMPLLIALGASVVLMRWQGRGVRGRTVHRELALEDFYTGYRRNVLQAGELLAWIKVPRPVRAKRAGPLGHAGSSTEWTVAYKVSKRFDDDISAVCLAVSLQIKSGVVVQASLGAGGVAATPVRARATEAALQGQPWTADTVQTAMSVLSTEFSPISDMRASANYRRTVLGKLLWRCWLESQSRPGDGTLRLDDPAALWQEVNT
jgi:xanthine dehydrogenase small subunit